MRERWREGRGRECLSVCVCLGGGGGTSPKWELQGSFKSKVQKGSGDMKDAANVVVVYADQTEI